MEQILSIKSHPLPADTEVYIQYCASQTKKTQPGSMLHQSCDLPGQELRFPKLNKLNNGVHSTSIIYASFWPIARTFIGNG
jgi:hypothetical protein